MPKRMASPVLLRFRTRIAASAKGARLSWRIEDPGGAMREGPQPPDALAAFGG